MQRAERVQARLPSLPLSLSLCPFDEGSYRLPSAGESYAQSTFSRVRRDELKKERGIQVKINIGRDARGTAAPLLSRASGTI